MWLTALQFYSSERFINDAVYCAYASNESMHVYFLADVHSREKSSGGPFHRDINLNYVGDYHSITFCMNSGHAQTEAFRTGFFGPYLFSFSGSSIPSFSDFDFDFGNLALGSYVGKDGRGYITGMAPGTSDDFDTVIDWYHDDYQGWASASRRAFTSPALVVGTYTQVLYQQELVAATTTVEVTAGATVVMRINVDSEIITADRTTLFQIGDYDGQPTGFLNADKFVRATLPRDSKAIPDSEVTARIATTLDFASGRPPVALNDIAADDPKAMTKIDSRGVTRGAYRGYGEV